MAQPEYPAFLSDQLEVEETSVCRGRTGEGGGHCVLPAQSRLSCLLMLGSIAWITLCPSLLEWSQVLQLPCVLQLTDNSSMCFVQHETCHR